MIEWSIERSKFAETRKEEIFKINFFSNLNFAKFCKRKKKRTSEILRDRWWMSEENWMHGILFDISWTNW